MLEGHVSLVLAQVLQFNFLLVGVEHAVQVLGVGDVLQFLLLLVSFLDIVLNLVFLCQDLF